MSGKQTQTEFEDERGDDVAATPHESGDADQDSAGSPDSGRQDSETASGT